MRAGAIVTWTHHPRKEKPRRLVGRVLSAWSGLPDSLVRVMDTSYVEHRLYADSLSLDVPADQATNAKAKIEAHLKLKRQKARAARDSRIIEIPDRGRGVPDCQDVPTEPYHSGSSDPRPALWLYLAIGGGERRRLAELRARNTIAFKRAVRARYPSQPLAHIGA